MSQRFSTQTDTNWHENVLSLSYIKNKSHYAGAREAGNGGSRTNECDWEKKYWPKKNLHKRKKLHYNKYMWRFIHTEIVNVCVPFVLISILFRSLFSSFVVYISRSLSLSLADFPLFSLFMFYFLFLCWPASAVQWFPWTCKRAHIRIYM